MNRFQTLSPRQAREIEENAFNTFTSVSEKKEEKVDENTEIVLKIKSVFPFELFPDELTIKKDKVTLINRTLPGTSMVRDMHMHDIAQAEADCGPIFGHLHVYSKLRTEEPLLIERVKRKDALKAREIIENLLVRVEPRSIY